MGGLNKRNSVTVKNYTVGLVVALFVIKGSQMAVYGLSSESRDPAVADTCWVVLESMQRLRPSRDG